MSAPWAMKSAAAPRTSSALPAYVPSLVTGFQPSTVIDVPLARLYASTPWENADICELVTLSRSPPTTASVPVVVIPAEA